MEVLKKNKKIVIGATIVVFIVGIIGFIYYSKESGGNFNIENWESSSEKNQFENNSDIINSANNSDATKNKNASETEYNDDEEIYIHIIGEVKNQGLISIKQGQRIIDAIEKAGGVTEQADLSKVNLAFVLSDGQKVRIPSVNEKEENVAYITDNSGNNVILDNGSGGSAGGRVNINTASQTELETLNGIGPSLAAKIIEYRNKNGKFKSIDDLRNVSGIGDSKFNGIRESVVVK